MVRQRDQNVIRQDRRDQSWWLHAREIDPDIDQGHGGVITLSTLLVAFLVWSQRDYKRVLETAISSALRDAAPRPSSEKKRMLQ